VDILSVQYGVEVIKEFVNYCAISVQRLDSLYYALVELRRLDSTRKIPAIALNSVITAAGRVGHVDRAFATFQEYKSVFGLEYDVHSYNALLGACAMSKNPKVMAILAIIQDMEVRTIACAPFIFMF
jgi:hypothetical protein